MPFRLLLPFIFSWFLISPIKAQNNNPFVSVIKNKNNTEAFEYILNAHLDYREDSLKISEMLNPLWKLAEEKKSIELKWLYNIKMADAYSVYYDNINNKSLFYYQQADSLVNDNQELTNLYMVTQIRWGYYYYIYRKVKQAFPYFLKASEYKNRIPPSKIPLVADHFSYMASFYSYIGDHGSSVEYLKRGIPYTKVNSRKRIDMLNSIGVYLRKDSIPDKSEGYFLQALEVAEQARDSVWIGIISGNISEFERDRGNLQKAIDLVYKNIYLSEKFEEYLDAMRAYIILAQYYLEKNEPRAAKASLYKAQGYIENKPYFLPYKMDIAKTMAEVAKVEGNKLKELHYLKDYISYRDTLSKSISFDRMQKIYWQWESERHQQSIIQAEQKKNQLKVQYQFIAISLFLIFVIIVLLINRLRNKEKIRSTLLEKDQLQLAFEKNKLDKEILVLKDSLEEFTDTIKFNNQTIDQLRQELNQSEKIDHEFYKQINDNLNSMLDSHIMTEDRWTKFKLIFDRVYPGYLASQKERFENLSDNDLRLLALIKLELSNRNMSELLGVTVDGIKKAKQRLKKKLETVH